MATTIINPPTNNNESSNNGLGFLLGVIVLVVFAVLFFIYILPYLGNSLSRQVPQVNVPKDINVKVQQGK